MDHLKNATKPIGKPEWRAILRFLADLRETRDCELGVPAVRMTRLTRLYHPRISSSRATNSQSVPYFLSTNRDSTLVCIGVARTSSSLV